MNCKQKIEVHRKLNKKRYNTFPTGYLQNTTSLIESTAFIEKSPFPKRTAFIQKKMKEYMHAEK